MTNDTGAEPSQGARAVVTAFLEHGGLVLLLRRAPMVRSFPGRWSGVSGSIPAGVSAEDQAHQEVLEEVGLPRSQVELVRAGPPLMVRDHGRAWLVHPFLFRVPDPSRVVLNWENTEARWVAPATIADYLTVPDLCALWDRISR